jgi:hypothetical protein
MISLANASSPTRNYRVCCAHFQPCLLAPNCRSITDTKSEAFYQGDEILIDAINLLFAAAHAISPLLVLCSTRYAPSHRRALGKLRFGAL